VKHYKINGVTRRVPEDWTGWSAENCEKFLAALTPQLIAREAHWFHRYEIRLRARARKARRGWR